MCFPQAVENRFFGGFLKNHIRREAPKPDFTLPQKGKACKGFDQRLKKKEGADSPSAVALSDELCLWVLSFFL
jgi:hypothetical protein